MNGLLAALVSFFILVPSALYFFSVLGREREQPEPEAQPEAPQFEPDPATMTVEQTWAPTTTNVALTWIKQVIAGRSDTDRPAIEPPRPRPTPQDDGPEWKPPANLDGLPDLTEYDVAVEVERPAPDTPQPPDQPPAAEALVIERGLLDWVRDWLGGSSGNAPPLPPEPVRPPSLGQADPDWLAAIPDPRQLPEPELPSLPEPELPTLDIPGGPDIYVEHIPATADAEPAEPIALPPADPPPETTVTAEAIEPVEVIAPVELQGVDMELVPVGRRTMARVPTPGGIRLALHSGGFALLRAWLAGFRKANLSDLGNAQHMHRLALMHTQRARVKLAIATNLLLAVQHDRLGPNVIRNCVATWQQCQREYTLAYQVATSTTQLVRASGGIPTSIHDAIRALERDHGGMARAARRMTVEPVSDLRWYQH